MEKSGLLLWLQWVLASATGGVLGAAVLPVLLSRETMLPFVTVLFMPFALAGAGGETAAMAVMELMLLLIAVAGLTLGGLGFAVPQWLILRRRTPQTRGWLRATMSGMLVGAVVGSIVGSMAFVSSENMLRGFLLALHGNTGGGTFFLSPEYLTASAWGAEVGKLAGGAAVGIIIGVAQRRMLLDQFSRADWWVFASMIGAAAMSPWLVAGFQRQSAGILAGLLYGLAGGASYGIVTGIALVRLVQHNAHSPLEAG